MARILAIDPGDVRIGLAISDPTGLIARPLKIIEHSSQPEDVRRILEEAHSLQTELILVGLPLNHEGEVGPQARKSLKLAEALRQAASIPVETWDESGTTKRALEYGGGDDMIDARAAAFLLQDYLDAIQ
jgi:putative Holliday junction resolvase